MKSTRLERWLQDCPPLATALFAGAAAFCTYSCMYAFRKPFTAASFADGPYVLGLSYKPILVISQVSGYALSKFLGIKFVSEASARNRASMILLLIAVAEIALLLFAVTPHPLQMVFLFANGIPLGMVWGLVFSYMEGRKLTEVMGLLLCASFLFASAFVKDVGRSLMSHGISESWMPFITGLAFAVPLVVSVWLLNHIPAPSEEDERLRTKRLPMLREDRSRMFRRFAFGIVSLVVVYVMLTAYRSFRDDFMADIWIELRGPDHDVKFSTPETRAMLAVTIGLMVLVLVRDSMRAFMLNHLFVMLGTATAGVSTWCFHGGMISDMTWMTLTGFGTYLAYVPFNCILFERMIAAFRHVGNVGFLIYIADAFGYLGSVSVLIYKELSQQTLSWIDFFSWISYLLAVVGTLGTLASTVYFFGKHSRAKD